LNNENYGTYKRSSVGARQDRLIVRNELSLKNMLSLFCETDNDSTKILINKILNEAGFAWFDKANPVEVKQSLEDALLEESQRDLQDDLTEIDLMRMLPVNNHLH